MLSGRCQSPSIGKSGLFDIVLVQELFHTSCMLQMPHPLLWFVACAQPRGPALIEPDSPGSGNVTLVKQPEFLNSGDSDASPDGSPSQFLLVRSLEPSVTEELLAKGVAKLYKPNSQNTQAQQSVSKKGNAKVASTTGDANLGAKEGSIRRVLLVRDRQTNESWRYGFAEFSSLEVGSLPFGL